ncbi:MAG: YIP1 family protein [Anaerolineales bacterium]
MLARIVGVFKLNVPTFEEIEHNTSLTLPAALIVILVSLISGVGNGLFNGFRDKSFASGFFGSVISVIVGWIIWSIVTWFVGTRLFKGQADLGEMLRVIGFAYLPMVLSIIPCLGGIIGIIWTIAAGFIAIRQGLDLDNTKAFLTVVVGAVLYVILTALLNVII